MEYIFGIILGLIILVILVIIHELGHALTAHRNGVVVEEFGVGFPPSLLKKKLKNRVLVSINLLPLGGFVKLQGEYDAADKKGDYGAASYFKKTKILLAGVVFNFLLAVILLTFLSFTGIPKILPNQVVFPGDTKIIYQPVEITILKDGFSAKKAGFMVGDKITKIANKDISTSDNFIELTKQYKGKNVDIVYIRDGVESIKKVTLRDNVTSGYFGAGLGQREYMKSTWSAPFVGLATTAQFSWATICSVGDLVGNLFNGLILQFNPSVSVRELAAQKLKDVGDSVAGPIGILGTIFPAAEQAGLTQLLLLTAIISLTLAVINVLPIPALDGGRWLVMTIYKLRKKVLTRKREEMIQTIGFSVLMGIVILVTIVDVAKLF